jgi:hypothetical protein
VPSCMVIATSLVRLMSNSTLLSERYSRPIVCRPFQFALPGLHTRGLAFIWELTKQSRLQPSLRKGRVAAEYASQKRKGAIARPFPSATKRNSCPAFSRFTGRSQPQQMPLGESVVCLAVSRQASA